MQGRLTPAASLSSAAWQLLSLVTDMCFDSAWLPLRFVETAAWQKFAHEAFPGVQTKLSRRQVGKEIKRRMRQQSLRGPHPCDGSIVGDKLSFHRINSVARRKHLFVARQQTEGLADSNEQKLAV